MHEVASLQYKVTLLWKGAKRVPHLQILPNYSGWERDGSRFYEVCLRTGAASSARSRATMNAPCIPSKKCPFHGECRVEYGSGQKDREWKERFFLELEGETSAKKLGSLLQGMSPDDPVEMMLRIHEAFHG